MKIKLYISSNLFMLRTIIVLHHFCDLLGARNDTTAEKFAKRSSKRTPSGILQLIARPLAHGNVSAIVSVPYAYILCSTSVYIHHTGCRATHAVAHTLTRCFITADLVGAQTRNGSLITTATAINPGMRGGQKCQ